MILDREGREKLRMIQATEYREVREAIQTLQRFDDEKFEAALASNKLKRPEWWSKPGNTDFLWFVHLQRQERKAKRNRV